ncbi:hypothetical protein [Geobacillus subterraneus]|uniref:Uncharacterized protein n=1 Tax=Geobacillus subterraneus TaxID=129338 RepID=A0A679FS49_9BACL|nr:hypothetical protein [Geobacillus subterraneus]BBW98973.1 hypothetical protein GsuE55_38060 [Geobacillus subterraneus]
MERLNLLGMELLEYKKELMNDVYNELVKKSLRLAVEQMATHRVIDANTFEMIQDPSVSAEEFRTYLLTKKPFVKTEEEIFLEFEQIRQQFETLLEREDVKTESVVKKELILATKSFVVDEAFVLEYFRVDEADLFKLMKRKGFVEKFAALRLRAIFEGFLEQLDHSDWIRTDASLVYFDKDQSNYAIDLFFELPIEEMEKLDRQKEAAAFIEQSLFQAEAYYEERVKP